MKYRIRMGMFETNSSSTHSIQFAMERKPEKPSADIVDGVLHATCRKFDEEDVFGEQEKLNYLCSYISQKLYWDKYECENSIYARAIINAYNDTFGDGTVKEIEFINVHAGEFDHQSSPYESECIVDIYDKSEIANFLFNEYIFVKCKKD